MNNYIIRFLAGGVFAIFLIILRIRTLKRNPTLIEWVIFGVFALIVATIFIYFKK